MFREGVGFPAAISCSSFAPFGATSGREKGREWARDNGLGISPENKLNHAATLSGVARGVARRQCRPFGAARCENLCFARSWANC
jgi:hypothetical protein